LIFAVPVDSQLPATEYYDSRKKRTSSAGVDHHGDGRHGRAAAARRARDEESRRALRRLSAICQQARTRDVPPSNLANKCSLATWDLLRSHFALLLTHLSRSDEAAEAIIGDLLSAVESAPALT
jgi:hypothetical protein